MEQLILRSQHPYPLRELVEGALGNESRLLQAGIARTEQRLQEFEARHRRSTQQFLHRYENDEIAETLELTEWIGEARMLERMRQQLVVLEDIQLQAPDALASEKAQEDN